VELPSIALFEITQCYMPPDSSDFITATQAGTQLT